MTEKKTEVRSAEASVFATLNAIDCSEHIEKKQGGKDASGRTVQLSYLSWAWAWQICKKFYPQAFYTIYENADGRPYFDDGRTAWVKTGVTIEGLEHIEYLPVMDYRNLSIPVDRITSMDMNKAIQRSLTKALARHGLGLYIYAGEDLPWTEDEAKAIEAAKKEQAAQYARQDKAAGKKPVEAAHAKKQAPARGSDEWNKWVAAIATNAVGLSGQKHDWLEDFKQTYHWDVELIEYLEGDVFNYCVDKNIPANA